MWRPDVGHVVDSHPQSLCISSRFSRAILILLVWGLHFENLCAKYYKSSRFSFSYLISCLLILMIPCIPTASITNLNQQHTNLHTSCLRSRLKYPTDSKISTCMPQLPQTQCICNIPVIFSVFPIQGNYALFILLGKQYSTPPSHLL